MAQFIEPRKAHPGSIRRTHGAVRKTKPRAGIKSNPGSVLAGPHFQLAEHLSALKTGVASSGRHHDDLSFRRAFDAQLAVGLAEVEEVLLAPGQRARWQVHRFLAFRDANGEQHI